MNTKQLEARIQRAFVWYTKHIKPKCAKHLVKPDAWNMKRKKHEAMSRELKAMTKPVTGLK